MLVANGLKFPEIPDELKLAQFELVHWKSAWNQNDHAALMKCKINLLNNYSRTYHEYCMTHLMKCKYNLLNNYSRIYHEYCIV